MRLGLKITARFGAFLLLIGACAGIFSCTDPETTDSSGFALFYAGITDIGPSMNFNSDAPTYIGGVPSGFAITGVTLDGARFDTDCFVIDENTGALSLVNTGELPVGLYALSISCYSGGNYYEFKEVVAVNMMKPVPDGIYVVPDKISAGYGEIVDPESSAELPAAQVTTDGDHISVKKYLIANVRKDGLPVEKNDFFKISESGSISIVRGKSAIQPGTYVLDLKLTTALVDEAAETGIFENALEIEITSEPLSLVYTPGSVRAEVNSEKVSAVPALTGSAAGLAYRIKAVSPANAPVSIDPATGVITLAAGNGLVIGDVCEVSVTVTNQYGSTDFEKVYAITMVPFINPITDFSYTDTGEIIQAAAFEHPVALIRGDEPQYAFVGLPAALGDLRIDNHTGTIYAAKGNSLPVGLHTVTVSAKNDKNEKQASFRLNVVKNPYYFTYVHWGNNLALMPARNYASQYRVTSGSELTALSIPVAESDIPAGVAVEYAIDKNNSSVNAAVIDKAGTITFSKGWSDAKVLMVLVTVTTGKGTAGEVTVKTPVFIDCSAAKNGVTVSYTPFVFQVNPRTGGMSVSPQITGTADISLFRMDYRRNFGFYNINGPESHKSGVLKAGETGTFMYSVWKSYYHSIGESSVNAGARKPMSYYDNTSLSAPLGYIDADNQWSVKINPLKWQNDDGYANGVMLGQITFVTDGATGNLGSSNNQVFPIAVWFDTKF